MGEAYFNGKPLSDFGLNLKKYEITPLPSINTRRINITGRDGVINAGTDYGTNAVILTLVSDNDSIADVIDSYRKFILYCDPKGNNLSLILSEDPDYIRRVKLDQTDAINRLKGIFNSVAEVSFTFIMEDPYVYKDEIKKTSIVVSNGESFTVENNGLETNVTISISTNSVEGSTITTLACGIGSINYGEYQSGSISNITTYINDRWIKYNNTLKTDEKLIIKTEDFDIYINNESVIRYWEGDFPQLQKGENTITISNDNNADMVVIVEFIERWLV